MANPAEATGFSEVRAMLARLSGELRATSAKSVEIAPAAADLPKAHALVRQGRDVFAVDAEMERRAVRAFDERAERELKRIADGHSGSMAACLYAAGEEVRTVVRGRIDDTEPTPGGKAPLKRPRADGSTDHIGRDTGALHAGLTVRLVGR